MDNNGHDKARDIAVEDRLTRFGVHWRWEESVAFDDIASDPNPARWQERYDEQHMTEIALAICDNRPVPASLLYKPPGAAKYRRIGGRHREEAAKSLGLTAWPAMVIDEPLDEFLIEALPIYDNVGMGKDYSKRQRLEFAAHLLAFRDHDPKSIATELQLKPVEITQFVELQAAMNRAHDQGIAADIVRKLPPSVLIEANKALPNLDAVFKAAVETLGFTEMQGHAAKGLIKDAASAKSEATAIAKLGDVYEKHKAELERRKRQGRKLRTPTLAQKLKKPVVAVETIWPGRIELLELNAHDDDFLCELEASARKAFEILHEVKERCAEIRTMRARSRVERREAKRKAEGIGATP